MTPINVDSWMDIIANLWVGIVVMAMAIIPGYMTGRKNHKGIKEIRDQVVNGHADAPPLRTDLDRVIASLDALAKDVTGLRRDLADEENRRRDHIAELRDEVNRKLSAFKRAG
jgi:hypothetical protein